MEKKIFLLICASLALTVTSFAQRQSEGTTPMLVYKKDNRPVPEKRTSSRTDKLFDSQDKTKAADFKIDNIDVQGLDAGSQNWDEKTKTLTVMVTNKGAKTSAEAYMGLTIRKSKTVTKVWGGGVQTSKEFETLGFDGKPIPALKANGTTFINFSLADKPYSKELSKSFFSAKNEQLYFSVTLVTEPIIIK